MPRLIGGRPSESLPASDCLAIGFSFAKIVARFSHCASLSSRSPASSLMAGKSVGRLTELELDVRECDLRCRRCDKRFSPRLDVVESTEAFEELRKREKCSEMERWSLCGRGVWSSGYDGGSMSS